ncbi:MAG: hypothetical protein RSB87_04225 [Clostridia bacterium]
MAKDIFDDIHDVMKRKIKYYMILFTAAYIFVLILIYAAFSTVTPSKELIVAQCITVAVPTLCYICIFFRSMYLYINFIDVVLKSGRKNISLVASNGPEDLKELTADYLIVANTFVDILDLFCKDTVIDLYHVKSFRYIKQINIYSKYEILLENNKKKYIYLTKKALKIFIEEVEKYNFSIFLESPIKRK